MSVILRSRAVELQHRDQREFALRDRRVTVDGMSTQYLEAGSGPPLLLLHGYEQSATSWRWVIPVLARTHRVLARACPVTETAPRRPGATPRVATWPRSWPASSTPSEWDRSTWSEAPWAVRLALADPSRVRTLTLVGSAGLGRDVNPLLVLAALPVLGELAILLSRVPGGDLQRTTISAAMLFAQLWRAPAEFVAEQHAQGRRAGQLEAATAMARALFDVNGQREVLLDQLHTLTMPTLVVWGGCDYVLPAYQAQAAVDCLPAGRLALFPDCGHLPHVECPDRFATVLSEFLTEHQHPGHITHRALPLAHVDL